MIRRIAAAVLLAVTLTGCGIAGSPRGVEDMRRDLCEQGRAEPGQCVESSAG